VDSASRYIRVRLASIPEILCFLKSQFSVNTLSQNNYVENKCRVKFESFNSKIVNTLFVQEILNWILRCIYFHIFSPIFAHQFFCDRLLVRIKLPSNHKSEKNVNDFILISIRTCGSRLEILWWTSRAYHEIVRCGHLVRVWCLGIQFIGRQYSDFTRNFGTIFMVISSSTSAVGSSNLIVDLWKKN